MTKRWQSTASDNGKTKRAASKAMRQEIKNALHRLEQRLDKTSDEEVEEWARILADDLSKFTD